MYRFAFCTICDVFGQWNGMLQSGWLWSCEIRLDVGLRRWANSASPAYGALSDHQTMRRHAGEKRQEKAKAAWGASLSSPADIAAVFVKYASGLCHARIPCPTQAFQMIFIWTCAAILCNISVNNACMRDSSSTDAAR